MITQERLKELLHYDPATGAVIWIGAASKYRSVPLGGSAIGAFRDKDGYALIKIDGASRRAHRVIWAWMTGEWPTTQIDHINRITDDNRWCNLRAATVSQNAANSKRRSSNTSGFKGVHFARHANPNGNCWRAACNYGGKVRQLGYFPTKEAAHAAYIEAARLTFGEYARTE